jgi:hypothetical protein
MKRYAVTVIVEAEDTLEAVEFAGDVFANMDAVHELAAMGEIRVRPARKDEAA